MRKKDIGLFKFDPTKRKSMFVSAIELLATEGGLCKEWLFSIPIPPASLYTFHVEFPLN